MRLCEQAIEMRKREKWARASSAYFRKLGINSSAMTSQTGRVEINGTLRLHKDEDDEHDFLGKLELMADSSCEPLDRLIALEEAVAQGIDEKTARTVLGMY